jgi:hypothetical protein
MTSGETGWIVWEAGGWFGRWFVGCDGGGPDGSGRGRRSSIEERRAAILPNWRCSPWIAAVRVSGGGSDDEVATVEDNGIEAWVIDVEEAPDDGLGGELGGTVADGAAEELAMGSDKATGTRLLALADLRR